MADAGGRTLGAGLSLALKRHGVDVVFGIPGVHNVELYRGIEEAGITHVLARNEMGAGFMADGYARASGRPGVAFVITGPGLTNIMTPMGQAWSDSVPMLVISSCLPEATGMPGRLHQMRDQLGAAAAVCEWSETGQDPAQIFRLLEQAFREFASQRPRPRHIQVPIDLLGKPADIPEPAPPVAVASSPIPLDQLGQVADRLQAATHPVFIFGGGAVGAAALARDLVSRTNAVSFTSYAGRGIISADTPLAYGSLLSRPESADVLAQSDCVVAIGTELAEVDLWRPALGAQPGTLIRVDIDPATLEDDHTADVTVRAEAGMFMQELLVQLGPHKAQSRWRASTVARNRQQWRAAVDADRPGIVPVVRALQQALPDNTLIYSDMTQIAYVAKDVWDMPAPGLWHHPYGFGTLGYGVPAAIGGKVARPDQPVVVIVGDSGFQYTMQELGTAAEQGHSLPIILWDNGKLKEIEECMVAAQIAPNAVVARNPDFAALAAAYGINYARPSGLPEMQKKVRAALTAPGPTLIHLTPEVSSSS